MRGKSQIPTDHVLVDVDETGVDVECCRVVEVLPKGDSGQVILH